jgi:23S rRNA pseudouridine1911/1915/1917 synthase
MRHPAEAAEFGSRARRFLPATIADMLPRIIADKTREVPRKLFAVHRLDRETSGLMLFARTRQAERALGKRFRRHEIERTYLAIVRGQAVSQTIESFLVRDRGDRRRGSTRVHNEGKRAVTEVRVLEEMGPFSLVECRLGTGRTHQVRIHLGEVGTPICGERIYDRPLHGRPKQDDSGSPRLALHAAKLGLRHPITGKHYVWHQSLPNDLSRLLRALRAKARAASKS